jgi:hypothetical protein
MEEKWKMVKKINAYSLKRCVEWLIATMLEYSKEKQEFSREN